jgi:putative nucleotidyltransferase with HDIG domain
LDELILLNQVSQAANSEIGLDQVLTSVARETSELLHSDDISIFLVNEVRRELEPAVSTKARPGRPASLRWGQGVVGWVAEWGQPTLIPDTRRDVRSASTGSGARSEICVPMRIGERVIGVISVGHPEENTYDQNDLRLLTTLGGQIAATIERARLLDVTQKRLDEMTALFEFSNLLRTATTEPRLLELIVSSAVNILRGQGGSLQFFKPGGEEMVVAAGLRVRAPDRPLTRLDGGVNWEVYESGEAVVIEDVTRDSRVRIPGMFERIRGVVVTPLRTSTGILGTLLVGFQQAGAPSAEKVQLATTIANLAAHAVQRLRLYEQTERQAQSLAGTLTNLEQSYEATLLALSRALDVRDRETEGHSQRVTRWALAIARRLGLSQAELTNLERGALLHDVGKIGISDNILLKPGALTPDERAVMNRHPELGYEMLKQVPFLADALPIVLYHQEMYDGSGYPRGLRGEEIPPGARVFAVADAFDAMTSTRPYRGPMSVEEAVSEIQRCSGTQFDPVVVKAFLGLFEDNQTPE